MGHGDATISHTPSCSDSAIFLTEPDSPNLSQGLLLCDFKVNMSLRALTEVLIHAHTFKNIDLFRQGVYRIQFYAYHENQGLQYPATPLLAVQAKRKAGDIPLNEPGLQSAETDDSAQTFSTKEIKIEFADEEIVLNDTCTFRIEIEVETEEPTLDILATLMYRETQTYEALETRRLRVKNPLTTSSEYVPIIFDRE
jgi:hypothetical protein